MEHSHIEHIHSMQPTSYNSYYAIRTSHPCEKHAKKTPETNNNKNVALERNRQHMHHITHISTEVIVKNHTDINTEK